MPLSRSPRMDRRRRAIREGLASSSGDASDESRISPSRTTRAGVDLPELSKKERGVAYSHSVRRACQHRLVQFIPVRKLSLTGAVAASVFVPALLMALHYLVFVSGTLDWASHPMSALLNASSPRSLAAWLSSHLWLLCLGSTVLTFRLRKHKLDDYDGEYRLWFWLVFTCIIGSIDSTTRLTELFGAALDRWSQLHVGWSGGAIVQATLATLIGLLGLRLCSELKSVPTSLVLWLFGLVCWAASAALSQSLLKLDISPALRTWCRAALWMGGLTSIWLCSLFYLRSIFMEAQKRFLTRAVLVNNAMPLGQRIRESIPSMPKLPKLGWKRREPADESVQEAESTSKRRKKPTLPPLHAQVDRSRDRQRDDDDEQDQVPSQRAVGPTGKSSSPESTSGSTAPAKRRWGLGGLMLRPPHLNQGADAASTSDQSSSPRSAAAQEAEVEREYGKRPGWFRRKPRGNDEALQDEKRSSRPVGGQDDGDDSNLAKRSLRDRFRWKRKPRDEEDGEDAEVRSSQPKQKAKSQRNQVDDDSDVDSTTDTKKRSWLRLPKPKMPKVSMPKVSLPRPKLPKLKLPSFRLQPPNAQGDEDDDNESTNSRVPSVGSSRPLPSTGGPTSHNAPRGNDQDADNMRGLSKAERKRLKRMQREDESDRRAA